jgi:hypothetical protein
MELFWAHQLSPGKLERERAGRIPGHTRSRRIQRPRLDVVAELIGLAPAKPRHFEFPVGAHESSRDYAIHDVRGVQPVVRDRRFRAVHDRKPVHEGRRTKCGLARQSGVDEQRITFAQRVRITGRHLDEQIVRMLPVDQWRDPIGRLAGLQQQRHSTLAHQRIGTQHRAKLQHVAARIRAPRHAHEHPGHERLVIAARPLLPVVDTVEQCMTHQHPLASHMMQARVHRCIGLPRRAGALPRHRVRAQHPAHQMAHVRLGAGLAPRPRTWPRLQRSHGRSGHGDGISQDGNSPHRNRRSSTMPQLSRSQYFSSASRSSARLASLSVPARNCRNASCALPPSCTSPRPA